MIAQANGMYPPPINLDDYSPSADLAKTTQINNIFSHADCEARQDTAGTLPQQRKEISTINYIKKRLYEVVA